MPSPAGGRFTRTPCELYTCIYLYITTVVIKILFYQDLDYIVWMDADAVVLNFQFSFEKLLLSTPEEAHVIVCSEYELSPSAMNSTILLNTGVK